MEHTRLDTGCKYPLCNTAADCLPGRHSKRGPPMSSCSECRVGGCRCSVATSADLPGGSSTIFGIDFIIGKPLSGHLKPSSHFHLRLTSLPRNYLNDYEKSFSLQPD
ncbi:hypothetical protein TNCV_113061 [Trichonephila clavipes]|nr:hypothetical protein TNCV_113061 [Trichonephila clavipes]